MNAQPYPPPYRASFVNRLMDLIKRLPLPYLLTYFLLFLFESALFHVVAWVDGWLPPYTFNVFALMFPLWLWGPLAIMTYLNSVALESLADFRLLIDIPDETMRQLQYEFTTMPARGAIINGVIWLIVYVVFSYLALDLMYEANGFGDLATGVYFVRGCVSFFIGSALYYHMLRQDDDGDKSGE